MKKYICCILLYVILIPSICWADVYVQPSTPTVYVAPDPYYQMGAALGNVFAQASVDRQIRQLEKKLHKDAKESVQMLVQAVDNMTIQQLSEGFRRVAFQAGGSCQVNENGNLWQGIWQMTNQGTTRYEEWSVDFSLMQARVLIRILPIGIEVHELAPLK